MATAKVKQAKLTCTSCGKEQDATEHHYKSNSFLSQYTGRLVICKACTMLLYQKMVDQYVDLEIAAYHTCRILDIYFSSDLWLSAVKQSKRQGSNHYQIYLQKVNSLKQCSSYTFSNTLDGERVIGVKAYNMPQKNTSLVTTPDEDNVLVPEIMDDENAPFVLTDKIVKFWGNVSRFTEEDYEFLTSRYEVYTNAYECDTPVMDELLCQAALESLEIQHKRGRGEDVSKNLKNLQELLGSANIKPNQETGANATEQATFGLLIKKWENEEPVPEPDEEWRDVDGIGKYIRVWFLGHLCKMMGVQSEYSKEYEDEMTRLRVQMPLGLRDEDEDDDDEGNE